MNIRQLTPTPEDIKLWKDIRLFMLQDHPEAYGSSHEEESSWRDEIFKRRLENNAIFGAFEEDELVATCCFHQQTSLKTQHRGFLWGIYTKEEHRGKGIGGEIMDHVINYAGQHVIQVHLTCVTENERAAAFYQKHGFEVYGTKPRSLYVNGEYYDEHLMVIDLADYTRHDTTIH